MIGALTGAAKTTAEAERLQVRARRDAALFAAARAALTAIAAAGLLDILWPWPVLLRGLFDLALLGFAVHHFLRFRRWMEREHLADAQVARAIEERCPDLDNALIHAVQFGQELAQNPAPSAALFMRREISRAQRLLAQLSLSDVVDSAPLAKERKSLLIVVGLLLLTALLFPRVYRFEIPRFALFWRDTPPFTLTDFDLAPRNASVRAGGDLTVSVRVGGLLPRRLELVTQAAGEGRESVPLLAAGNGVYTATLESLRRETAYMAVADTGRSAWGRVVIAAPHSKPQAAPHQAGTPPVTSLKQQQESSRSAPYRALVEAMRGLARDQRRLAEEMSAAAKEAQNLRPGDNAPGAKSQAQRTALRQRQRELQTQAEDLARRMRALARRPAQYAGGTGLPRHLTRLAKALRATGQGAMQTAQTASTPTARADAAQQAAEQMEQVLNGDGAAIERAARTPQRTLPHSQNGNPVSTPGSETSNGTSGSNGGGSTSLGRSGQSAGSRPLAGKNGGSSGERINALSATTGERPDSAPSRALPTAKDRDASRYPAEYRNLVRDYFQAVAGGK